MELVQKIFSKDSTGVVAFAESRIGGRKENQDSYGWTDTHGGYLVTVCDGMGGGPGGKTASTIAVREIIRAITDAPEEEELTNIIIKAVRQANMAIIAQGQEMPSLKGMGSTATVLLIMPEAAYVAHVGDSRVYQLRHGKKVFRTFDHSMVFEMVAQGIITEEQARLSASSNVITRALGIKPDLEVTLDIVPYEKGDRFILCSDGIHGTMPEPELIKRLCKGDTLGKVTDDVATYVDDIGGKTGGGHDNLTLVMVETTVNSKMKRPLSKQRLLIAILIALIVIGCAIWGVSNYGGEGTVVPADSSRVDSVKQDTTKSEPPTSEPQQAGEANALNEKSK
jgi:protein phosphatase